MAEPPAIAPQVQALALPEAGTAPPPQATAFDYAAHALARAAAHEPTANPILASTSQPEPEGGEQLIAAARNSLPLRGATQLRRGTKHLTPPRHHPPASEPDAAPPSTVRPKKKGPRRGLPQWNGPPEEEARYRADCAARGIWEFGSPRL